jgi:hypothetical protein
MSRPAVPTLPDFSLVLGGPLYQLFRRAHLTGDTLQLLRRRLLVITAIAWLPLLVLAAMGGHAYGGAVDVPFLYDIEVLVRFLVVLPVLIAAELLVHQRIRPVVAQFVERGIVADEELPAFQGAIDSTLRLRNSVAGEILLIAVVYTIGLWVWRNQMALESASWYAVPGEAGLTPTPAGYWYFLVSVPVFQFILLRWYLRIALWFWFLWQVSRLNLRLVPIHPDRACGLGFLGTSTYAFSPLLFAQCAMVAGLIANQVFHAGRGLMEFRVEVAGFVAFVIVALLLPLIVFAPRLAQAKRAGLASYGRLASRYVGEFERKWVRGGAPASGELLGSGDIQSLADLGTGYAVVREVRIVPFALKDVTRLAVVAVVPFLPLALTIFSLEELIQHAVKILF